MKTKERLAKIRKTYLKKAKKQKWICECGIEYKTDHALLLHQWSGEQYQLEPDICHFVNLVCPKCGDKTETLEKVWRGKRIDPYKGFKKL